MTKGEKIVYRCLAGWKYDAIVLNDRKDGTVDIGVDVGSKDLFRLSEIEVLDLDAIQPGTCARGVRVGR